MQFSVVPCQLCCVACGLNQSVGEGGEGGSVKK